MKNSRRIPPIGHGRVRALLNRSKGLAAVLAGNLSRAVLRGLFKLVLFGLLAPSAMGVLRAVYALFKLTSRIADLALDHAAVTLVSAALQRRDTVERDRVLASVLSIKLLLAAATAVIGNVLAERITVWALGDASLVSYTRWVFLAVGGQLLWRYMSGYLSAHREFGRLALFLTTAPALMLGAVGTLIGLNRFDLGMGIAVHLLAPSAAVLFWWPWMRRDFRAWPGWHGPTVRRILGFSRWVYLTGLASATRNHANPLLLKHPGLSGSLESAQYDAGLYGFGSDLAAEITILSQSMFTYLLPQAARKQRDGLRRYVKRWYRLLLFATPLLAAPFFLVRPLLEAMGQLRPNYLEYLPSLPIFMVLYAGSLISLASIPMITALYSIGRPQIETYLELATAPLLVLGSILLIPRYGPMGAAAAVLAQRLATFLALLAFGTAALRPTAPPG